MAIGAALVSALIGGCGGATTTPTGLTPQHEFVTDGQVVVLCRAGSGVLPVRDEVITAFAVQKAQVILIQVRSAGAHETKGYYVISAEDATWNWFSTESEVDEFWKKYSLGTRPAMTTLTGDMVKRL